MRKELMLWRTIASLKEGQKALAIFPYGRFRIERLPDQPPQECAAVMVVVDEMARIPNDIDLATLLEAGHV